MNNQFITALASADVVSVCDDSEYIQGQHNDGGAYSRTTSFHKVCLPGAGPKGFAWAVNHDCSCIIAGTCPACGGWLNEWDDHVECAPNVVDKYGALRIFEGIVTRNKQAAVQTAICTG